METQLFWARNKVPVLVALVAILGALAAYGAFQFYAARRDAAAANALAQAKSADAFQKVISDHPSTPAAASARLLLAAEQRKGNKFAEANATLQKFLDTNPKHELVTTAKMAIAANLESLGNTDEALDTYRRLAADYPKDFNAPLAMIAQVPILKRSGNTDDARKVCEAILTQYRESYASAEASQQLRQMKLAEAPPTDSAVNALPAPAGADSDSAPAQDGEGSSIPLVEISPAASAVPTP